MKKNKILNIALVTSSLLVLMGCQTTIDLTKNTNSDVDVEQVKYEDVSNGTKSLYANEKFKHNNDNWKQSNFYGSVVEVQKVQSSKNQSKIIVQGERGTRVAIYTNGDFKVGDKVLFKGLKSKHELYHIKKVN